MKLFLLSSVLFLFLSSGDCHKKTASTNYKGRLEIAGICLNYTIKLLEGNIDTSQIESHWTDEMTGKSYTNVFALVNPCVFPANIKQGEEFYFKIDTAVKQQCITCLAYYPKPQKKLSIVVIEK
jgi:hypothetical protein